MRWTVRTPTAFFSLLASTAAPTTAALPRRGRVACALGVSVLSDVALLLAAATPDGDTPRSHGSFIRRKQRKMRRASLAAANNGLLDSSSPEYGSSSDDKDDSTDGPGTGSDGSCLLPSPSSSGLRGGEVAAAEEEWRDPFGAKLGRQGMDEWAVAQGLTPKTDRPRRKNLAWESRVIKQLMQAMRSGRSVHQLPLFRPSFKPSRCGCCRPRISAANGPMARVWTTSCLPVLRGETKC